MTFIIVEDEPKSRVFLQQLMMEYFSDWKLLGVCSTVSEGIEAIESLNPNLVLMDIEIGEGTSFDILNHFKQPNFKVIFTSAYEHYALKAIKYAALDYIMKPINVDDLETALTKISKQSSPDNRIEQLRNQLPNGDSLSTIMLPTSKGYLLVKLDEVNYVEADGQYVIVHLIDKKQLVASHSLGYYETLLSDSYFFRVHKSFIVNTKQVAKLITQPTPKVELLNGKLIDLAHRRKEAFITLLKNKNRS